MNAASISSRPGVTAAGASMVAGVAFWLSRASFDLAGTADAPQRVAMLPALPELAGLVVLSFLTTAAIASLLRERRNVGDRARFWDPAVIDVLRPSFALILLVLPYLPWLPDAIPALRLLAGPGRAFVWMIVLGQVTWLLLSELARRRQPHLKDPAGSFAPSLVIFAVSFAVYVWASSYIVSTGTAWPSLVLASGVAALVWVSCVVVSHSKAAATFAWASVCLSAPFVLNSPALAPGMFLDMYSALRQLPGTTFGVLASGAPGLLFDQEFGLFAYAPVLLLAFIGLAGMARDRSVRGLAIALSGAALAVISVAGSTDPWWSEMMPGRRVLLLLPLLAPAIAWLYSRTARSHLRRAGLQILQLAGLAVTLTVVLAFESVPVPQEGDGSSSLLQWMSPTWRLWNDAPSYVAGPPLAASVLAAVWLAAFATVGWLLSRGTSTSAGRAALFATTVVALSGIAVVSTSAALPLGGSQPRLDAESRGLFPMLETFDPIRRPIAVKYDPLSVVEPNELPPLFSLSALPGQQRGRQPVRVVLNARFRLPAGEYELDLKGSELAGTVPNPTIALQIGREGRPIEAWPAALLPGDHARYRFRLPVDAQFVGFRASREVERTIAELRLTPVRVVAMSERFRTPIVRSAARFGPSSVFFHDADAYPEPEGFWVRGRATAHLTILKPSEGDPSVTLTIHSGARPNAVSLETPYWSERIDLTPGVTAKIVVPSNPGGAFISLSIRSADGFVPADLERRNRDRRLLGAWIAFAPND